MSLFVIGDVHGCLTTLKRLLDKMPANCKPVLVGDLVDRGPQSRGVIDFVRSNKIACVLGNHELMMTDLSISGIKDWFRNGGDIAYSGYFEDDEFDADGFRRDLEWLRSLPFYLEFKEEYKGMRALISHSTLSSSWSRRNSVAAMYESTWERSGSPKKIQGYYNIFGHTPVKKPVIGSHFADVDTGCVFRNNPKYGKLTALQFPEMKIFQQPNKEQW